MDHQHRRIAGYIRPIKTEHIISPIHLGEWNQYSIWKLLAQDARMKELT